MSGREEDTKVSWSLKCKTFKYAANHKIKTKGKPKGKRKQTLEYKHMNAI